MNNEDQNVQFQQSESVKKKPFTMICNNLLSNKYNLSIESLGTICHLLHHKDGWFVYKDTLMEKFNLSEKKARRIFGELKSKGFMRLTPKRNPDGTFHGWLAEYSDYPEFLSSNSENPPDSVGLIQGAQNPHRGEPPLHNNTNSEQYCSNNINNNVPSQTSLSKNITSHLPISSNKRARATISSNEIENADECDAGTVDVFLKDVLDEESDKENYVEPDTTKYGLPQKSYVPTIYVKEDASKPDVLGRVVERDDPSELYRVKAQFEAIGEAFQEEATRRPSGPGSALRAKLVSWGMYELRIDEVLAEHDHKYLTALVSHVESVAKTNPGALFNRFLRDNLKIPPSTTTSEQSPRQEPKRVVIPLDESKAWYKAMTEEQKTGWIDRAKRQFPFLDGHITHGKVGFLDQEFTESSAFKVFMDVIGRPSREGY